MLAQRMHAVAKLLSGAIEEAVALYRVVLAKYDPARHGPLRFGYVSDQGAVAHAHLAWALAIAGRASEARFHSRAALNLAGRLAGETKASPPANAKAFENPPEAN